MFVFLVFSARVVDLIKDVVFIAGSSSVFRHMLAQLKSEAAVTWETNEAALFVMHAVAKSLHPSESEVVPQVVESILSMQENEHVAVKQTSIRQVTSKDVHKLAYFDMSKIISG